MFLELLHTTALILGVGCLVGCEEPDPTQPVDIYPGTYDGIPDSLIPVFDCSIIEDWTDLPDYPIQMPPVFDDEGLPEFSTCHIAYARNGPVASGNYEVSHDYFFDDAGRVVIDREWSGGYMLDNDPNSGSATSANLHWYSDNFHLIGHGRDPAPGTIHYPVSTIIELLDDQGRVYVRHADDANGNLAETFRVFHYGNTWHSEERYSATTCEPISRSFVETDLQGRELDETRLAIDGTVRSTDYIWPSPTTRLDESESRGWTLIFDDTVTPVRWVGAETPAAGTHWDQVYDEFGRGYRSTYFDSEGEVTGEVVIFYECIDEDIIVQPPFGVTL